MSNASGSQILTCTGQLKVDIGTSQNVASQGAVKFTGRLPSGKEIEYAGMKVWGYGGFGYLLLESLPTTLQQGFNIRTIAAQGGTEIGGVGEPFVFQALGNVCKMRNVEIRQPTTSNLKQQSEVLLSCIRRSTQDSLTRYYSPICQISQSQLKESEGIFYGVGDDPDHNVLYGVISPDGSSTSINNFGSIGIQRGSTTYYESIRFDVNQNVTIPKSLTADTISATTYLNLPAVPAGDLLPLTLDKTNNFVGINNLVPSDALDVTGNAKVSGNIAVGSGGTTITSSSSSPEGAVSAPVGSLYMRTDGSTGTSVYVKEAGSGNTGWNTLTGPQGPVGPVGPQGPQGPAGTPGITDLLPLTLDKVNNRVGVNKTVPTEALDVVGSVATDTSVVVNGTLVLSGTATPEGSKTAPVGSLYLRKDGGAGTCLYVKESGTGNTGWVVLGSGASNLNCFSLRRTEVYTLGWQNALLPFTSIHPYMDVGTISDTTYFTNNSVGIRYNKSSGFFELIGSTPRKFSVSVSLHGSYGRMLESDREYFFSHLVLRHASHPNPNEINAPGNIQSTGWYISYCPTFVLRPGGYDKFWINISYNRGHWWDVVYSEIAIHEVR